MSGASTSDARKRRAPVADPVEIVARHHESYDSDCGFYYGCACGWDNDSDSHNKGFAEHLVAALRAEGMLP